MALSDVYKPGAFPATTGVDWVVDKLLMQGTTNLLVGDSGLGKTPLAITLGLSVAAGVPFLGRPTHKGVVLYCDGESNMKRFITQQETISKALGLSSPPLDFNTWSPYWGSSGIGSTERMFEIVRELKPDLIVIDTLRAFWPDADQKADIGANIIRSLRAAGGTWLVTHHPRKPSREFAPPSLKDDPNAWFQEAAGSRALVNHTDSRLGVEKGSGGVELLLGGFVRYEGPLQAIQLGRIYDPATGEPLAYELATGIDFLSDKFRIVFDSLPGLFHFKDVVGVMGGKSASNAARFIQQCKDVKVIEAVGKAYAKTTSPASAVGASTP